jgi:hypothetical protein
MRGVPEDLAAKRRCVFTAYPWHLYVEDADRDILELSD